ncbi:MAG: hypothetical protein ABIB71_04600 [Candidatus Woesearchaeota archaeon]
MTGEAEGKHELKGIKVYIHEKGKAGATVTHIDIEGEAIASVIKEGETTFVKGKSGGVFIALKKPMIERAEELISSQQ